MKSGDVTFDALKYDSLGAFMELTIYGQFHPPLHNICLRSISISLSIVTSTSINKPSPDLFAMLDVYMYSDSILSVCLFVALRG